MKRGIACVGLLLTLVGGCEDEVPVEQPPPSPTEPEGPPPIPALSDLAEPSSGRAQVAFPQWSADDSRFSHPIQSLAAKRGAIEGVTQILLGDTAETGIMLQFYGNRLPPGTYRVLPATDETRSEHATSDARIFIVTLGEEQGDLRSTDGSVVIEASSDEAVSGTVEATLRSRNMLRETVVRARFAATDDDWLRRELEHQQAIREQLRNR